MKNLIFGLIATVFLSAFSFAQEVANKSNPFDNVGKQHNEVVNEFLTRYGDQKLSVSKTLEVIDNICKSKSIEGKRLTTSEFNAGIIDIKNNFRETVNKSSLSKDGKVELQKLFDYILNNGFNGSVEYLECHNYILNFEKGILESKLITNADREILLKSTSVGRYSINLWYTKFNNENDNNHTRGRGWFSWVIIGAADICGGVAGGGAFSVPGAIGASSATIGFLDDNNKR